MGVERHAFPYRTGNAGYCGNRPPSVRPGTPAGTLIGFVLLPGLCLAFPEPADPLGDRASPVPAVSLSASASNLINEGNLEAVRNRLDQALAAYLESAELGSRIGRHDLAAKALANAARIERFRSHKDVARHHLLAALEHSRSLPTTPAKAELLLGLGRLLGGLEPGDTERAYQALTEAVAITEALGSKDLRSYGYGYLGALYLDRERTAEALDLTHRAEFLAQTIGRPEILFRWQWQRGRIHKRRGALSPAITAYRDAVATLRPIRREVFAETVDFEPSDPAKDFYYELADLLLRQAQPSNADLMEIRNIVEQSKAVELENYYRDDCVAAWQDKSSGIDRLAGRTAAIYPIVLPDRLELLLSLPSGMERHTVKKGSEDIRREAGLLRQTLETRGTPEFLPHAEALYQILVEPLEPSLARNHVHTLVFVPDASFRLIPLAALHDGKDFLVRRYAIATSPGLTLTDPHPLHPDRLRALLAGLSEPAQGFPPLPNVATEIHRIAEEFPSTLLENGDFRRDTLQQQLAQTPYRIVHIASHGQFGRAVDNTFLLAADGRIGMDALSRIMGVSRFRDEPVEILTLSACQTAAGDDLAALGLAGIAVKAGVRSALASLWFINDPASAALVSEFYRQLKQPGLSKAQSLQRAQWSLLDDPRYEHPAYWAPFLLIGNWL